MTSQRRKAERRATPSAGPKGRERRRASRRHADRMAGGARWPTLIGAGALGVAVGLAITEWRRLAVVQPPPTQVSAKPHAAPRAPDHAHVVALRRDIEGLTVTDLVLDDAVQERWILQWEQLQPRFADHRYPETRPHLAAIKTRFMALGVPAFPTVAHVNYVSLAPPGETPL